MRNYCNHSCWETNKSRFRTLTWESVWCQWSQWKEDCACHAAPGLHMSPATECHWLICVTFQGGRYYPLVRGLILKLQKFNLPLEIDNGMEIFSNFKKFVAVNQLPSWNLVECLDRRFKNHNFRWIFMSTINCIPLLALMNWLQKPRIVWLLSADDTKIKDTVLHWEAWINLGGRAFWIIST